MPVTQWNDEEDLALQGLPYLAQIIYLRCLRRYMDYRTGVVGRARKISYQMIMECCEISRDWGSNRPSERPTRAQIRAALAQLERAGLIAPAAKPHRYHGLVYQLLMASYDKDAEVRPQKERPRNDQGTTKEERPEEQQRGATKGADNVTPLYIGRTGTAGGTTKERPAKTPEEQRRNDQPDAARNDIHPGSDLPDLTTPVEFDFSEQELKHIPGRREWIQFICNQCRFDFHEVMQSPKVRQMVLQWAEWKLSVDEAATAIEAAEHKLGRRPDTPMWYAGFVEEVVQHRTRDRSNQSPQPQGGRHGRTKLAHKSGAGIIGAGFEDSLGDESEEADHEH